MVKIYLHLYESECQNIFQSLAMNRYDTHIPLLVELNMTHLCSYRPICLSNEMLLSEGV